MKEVAQKEPVETETKKDSDKQAGDMWEVWSFLLAIIFSAIVLTAMVSGTYLLVPLFETTNKLYVFIISSLLLLLSIVGHEIISEKDGRWTHQ